MVQHIRAKCNIKTLILKRQVFAPSLADGDIVRIVIQFPILVGQRVNTMLFAVDIMKDGAYSAADIQYRLVLINLTDALYGI